MVKQFCLAAGIVALAGGSAWAQSTAPDSPRQLRLSFDADGSVRLLAQHVSVREVLAEWARQCNCYVVNADRLTGAPLSIPVLFEAAPQATVLRSLLKDAAGFVLTPRRAGPGPSIYETIYVMPSAAAAPVMTYMGERTLVQPAPPTPGAPDDELAPVRPVTPPEPIDPMKPTNQPGADDRRNPGVGVTVPGVRIVPITPVGPGSAPAAPPPPPPPPGR